MLLWWNFRCPGGHDINPWNVGNDYFACLKKFGKILQETYKKRSLLSGLYVYFFSEYILVYCICISFRKYTYTLYSLYIFFVDLYTVYIQRIVYIFAVGGNFFWVFAVGENGCFCRRRKLFWPTPAGEGSFRRGKKTSFIQFYNKI